MAGGWARDGAVNEQIDASIQDELARLKARPETPLCLKCQSARETRA